MLSNILKASASGPPPPPISFVGFATTGGGQTGVTRTANLPSGAQVGDTFIRILLKEDTGTNVSFPSGWVQFLERELTNEAYGMSLRYKTVDGTEGSTVTYTASVATTKATIAWCGLIRSRVASTNPQGTSITVSPASTSLNPPAFTPTWPLSNTLWIACFGGDGDDDFIVTTYPTGYTLGRSFIYGNDELLIGVAIKIASLSSDDPSAFTISQAMRGVVVTAAIRGN